MDRYIATDLSKFTAAIVPDISAHEKPWFANYIVNSMVRAEAMSPDREYRFNLLRRLTIAFREYGWARNDTLECLEALEEQRFKAYFWALHHWEQCLGASWHAFATLGKMSGGVDLFQTDDEHPVSTPQRVNRLYNASKHTEGGIECGDMPAEGMHRVWLCNDGIRSKDVVLPYEDVAQILTETADWFANVFEDPMTTRERALEVQAALAEREALENQAASSERDD